MALAQSKILATTFIKTAFCLDEFASEFVFVLFRVKRMARSFYDTQMTS